jgi:hypothetical protein
MQLLHPEILIDHVLKLHPERVASPFYDRPLGSDLAENQLGRRDNNPLMGAGSAIIRAKSPVDQRNVQPENPGHRPRAGHQENQPGDEAHAGNQQHHDHKAALPERAMRGHDGGKQCGF